LKLPVDKVALDNALGNVCFKCGSTQIVSSVMTPSFDNDDWVCKQCRDDIRRQDYEGKVRFGDEGFLDDNLTIYDQMEIVEKITEFNVLFEDKGCCAMLLYGNHFHCRRVEIIVDDSQPELAAAVKAAESIEKLCRHKVPFSRRRR